MALPPLPDIGFDVPHWLQNFLQEVKARLDPLNLSPELTAALNTGADGTFMTADSKTVIVTKGIITSIEG